MGVCPKSALRESLLCGKFDNWDRISSSNSPRARGTTLKFGNERVHREELFRSVSLMSAIRVLQNLRKEHTMKPCSKKYAPAEKHGNRPKSVYKLKNRIKVRFTLLLKQGQCRRGTRIPSRLRSITAHAEQKGFEFRYTGYPSKVQVMANVQVQANEEALVHVYNLDLFATVQLLDDMPALLSL